MYSIYKAEEEAEKEVAKTWNIYDRFLVLSLDFVQFYLTSKAGRHSFPSDQYLCLSGIVIVEQTNLTLLKTSKTEIWFIFILLIPIIGAPFAINKIQFRNVNRSIWVVQ